MGHLCLNCEQADMIRRRKDAVIAYREDIGQPSAYCFVGLMLLPMLQILIRCLLCRLAKTAPITVIIPLLLEDLYSDCLLAEGYPKVLIADVFYMLRQKSMECDGLQI